MSSRIERFSSTLKNAIADILLHEVQNPHLKLAVIMDIIVTPDLKKARIFIDTLPGVTHADAIRELDRARGFIKKKLAQKMVLKYMPELYFLPMVQNGQENEKESS